MCASEFNLVVLLFAGLCAMLMTNCAHGFFKHMKHHEMPPHEPIHITEHIPYPVHMYKYHKIPVPYKVPIVYKPIIKTVKVPIKIPYPVKIKQPYPVKVPYVVKQPYPVYIKQTIPVPYPVIKKEKVHIRVPVLKLIKVKEPYPVKEIMPIKIREPYVVKVKDYDLNSYGKSYGDPATMMMAASPDDRYNAAAQSNEKMESQNASNEQDEQPIEYGTPSAGQSMNSAEEDDDDRNNDNDRQQNGGGFENEYHKSNPESIHYQAMEQMPNNNNINHNSNNNNNNIGERVENLKFYQENGYRPSAMRVRYINVNEMNSHMNNNNNNPSIINVNANVERENRIPMERQESEEADGGGPIYSESNKAAIIGDERMGRQTESIAATKESPNEEEYSNSKFSYFPRTHGDYRTGQLMSTPTNLQEAEMPPAPQSHSHNDIPHNNYPN